MTSRICTRCIVDSTVPGVRFDDRGVCNYCKLHDELDLMYPLGEEGKNKLDKLVNRIKREGRGRGYDCIVGISGGRDSIYTLWLSKQLGLRPLAVHFNDGMGNPVAGENMKLAVSRLDVELRTITSDWRESKDIRIACLKASIPNLNMGTDLGIATALFGTAAKENVRTVFIGQSFRTEGVAPLEWNYLDGRFLKAVHDEFGKVKLRPWKAEDPGYHLGLREMAYYLLWRRIKPIPILYYVDYVRGEAEAVLKNELGWEDTGAHYLDDLYQSILHHVQRVKFNLDRRKFNYSALVRSGQMEREEALKRVKTIYALEDPKLIDLCIKRLGLEREEFDKIIAEPPKTFRDYETNYDLLRKFKYLIKLLVHLNLVPGTTYKKYFEYV